MKHKRQLILGMAIIAFVGLSACKTSSEVVGDEPTPTPVQPVETPVEAPADNSLKEIAKGTLYGNGEEGLEEGGMAINSEEEWNEIISKLNAVNMSIQPKSIDFDKQTVLVYIDKVRPSGGYSVEITNAEYGKGGYFASVKTTDPEGSAIEIMTQPFHIVAMKKTDYRVMFTVIE